jgi:hypothetical protein
VKRRNGKSGAAVTKLADKAVRAPITCKRDY